jgi:hypothetical protein
MDIIGNKKQSTTKKLILFSNSQPTGPTNKLNVESETESAMELVTGEESDISLHFA